MLLFGRLAPQDIALLLTSQMIQYFWIFVLDIFNFFRFLDFFYFFQGKKYFFQV